MITIHPILTTASLKSCAPILMTAYNGEPWNDNWTEERAYQKIKFVFDSPNFLGWVATENGQPVGACIGNREFESEFDYFYLRELFVDPTHQHKGIGKLLFQAVNKSMKAMEIPAILLFTGTGNHVYDFWKKQGFNDFEGMQLMLREG